MKKILISLFACASLSAFAQTNTPSGPSWLSGTFDNLTSLTNWSANVYGTYAPDAPKKFGAGLLAVYNVSQNVGLGFGVDEIGGTFNMISADVSLQLPTQPLKFIGIENKVTLFGIGGIAKPMGGAGTDNGGISTITGTGAALDLFDIKGWKGHVGYEWSYWSGAGPYSGQKHHIFIGVRKGF